MNINKKDSRRYKRIGWGILGLVLMSCLCLKWSLPHINGGDEKVKVINAVIDHEKYTLTIRQHQLYCEEMNGQKPLLNEKVLDGVSYDFEKQGTDDLIILTLGEEDKQLKRSFGKMIQIYSLSFEDDHLKARCCYENDIASVHPFMVKAGRLERREKYGNIFVGVYKDTLYYPQIINRPFFFSWNGDFIERKWTGSFFSHYEMSDMAFVDAVGDGVDEVAVLEKISDHTYRVALYKWLGFGFDYLAESDQYYQYAVSLKASNEQKTHKVFVCYFDGTQKEVKFKA